uniref:C-type lectin domain-containing protein n=1 Tax=Romanomermis culicivorax TaxID=13658 RepID=A0A915ICA7_ROMCU
MSIELGAHWKAVLPNTPFSVVSERECSSCSMCIIGCQSHTAVFHRRYAVGSFSCCDKNAINHLIFSTWQVVDNRNITIGARQVQPGVYQMLDGAWLYSDWYTFGGQPSTISGMDCVTMRDMDGYQWRSIDCNNTPVYTICQLNCSVTGQLTTP